MYNESPFISIITVCYNSEKTIERTIKSVLCQDFKDYEYIIVDGASSDRTLSIIKQYELLFEGRLKLVSESDNGIYDAFTKGSRLATGHFVWIVNSDDYLEPNALDTIYKAIKDIDKKDIVVSFGMNFRSSDGNKIIQVQRTNKEWCKKNFENDSMGVLHPATIVSKSTYEKTGYYCPEFRIIGDIDWFHRAYARQDVSFFFRDEVITNMCDGGISNVFDFKKSSKDRKLFLKRKYTNPIRRWFSYLKWVKLFYSQKRIHERKVS